MLNAAIPIAVPVSNECRLLQLVPQNLEKAGDLNPVLGRASGSSLPATREAPSSYFLPRSPGSALLELRGPLRPWRRH